MSKIHWIHISDLHLNMVGTQTSTLRDDLPSYIQNIAKKEKIQYIFITGDLRFAKKNKFSDNTTCYFEKLRSAAGIDKQSQFFVVGNHDVDRKNRTRLKAITEVEETYFENDSVISSNLIKGLKAGRTGLLNQLRGILTEEQYALHANPKILHFLVKTNDLNIVHVDSTVTYSDKRKNDFIIGSYALREVLQSCDKDKPTIILSHYPPSSLEPNEEKAVLKILKSNKVQLWLAGHKHTEIIYKDLDYVYVVHSGNQTFEKKTSPGFVEGHFDTESGRGYFRVHKWNESAGWAVYQTLSNDDTCVDGTIYPFFLDADSKTRDKREESEEQNRAYRADIVKYLNEHRGNTVLTRTILNALKINSEQLVMILQELQDEGYVRVTNAKNSQWEIIHRPI